MARWIHKEAKIQEQEDIITIAYSSMTKIYYITDGTPIRFIVVVVPIEDKKVGIHIRLIPHHYYPIRLTVGKNISIKTLNFKDTYVFQPIKIVGTKDIILGLLKYEHFPTLQQIQGRSPDIISEEIEGGEDVNVSLSRKNQD